LWLGGDGGESFLIPVLGEEKKEKKGGGKEREKTSHR
jgi:hypothetical protein